jgi:hypothetical protein
MKPVRDVWTDERLDDLNHRVDEGFRELRGEIQVLRTEMNGLRTEITSLRTEMNARLDAMQRTMLHGFIAMAAATLAGFGGLAALIATQL